MSQAVQAQLAHPELVPGAPYAQLAVRQLFYVPFLTEGASHVPTKAVHSMHRTTVPEERDRASVKLLQMKEMGRVSLLRILKAIKHWSVTLLSV